MTNTSGKSYRKRIAVLVDNAARKTTIQASRAALLQTELELS